MPPPPWRADGLRAGARPGADSVRSAGPSHACSPARLAQSPGVGTSGHAPPARAWAGADVTWGAPGTRLGLDGGSCPRRRWKRVQPPRPVGIFQPQGRATWVRLTPNRREAPRPGHVCPAPVTLAAGLLAVQTSLTWIPLLAAETSETTVSDNRTGK